MKRTIEKILKKIGFPKEPSKWNAAKIIHLLIASRTPRIGQLAIEAVRMWNTRPETAYKGIYRYLQKHDPQDYLILMAGAVHRKRVIFLCYHSSAGQKPKPDNNGSNR